MTSGRYILARIAQSFGVMRRTKRTSDAAFETQLLREAEEALGSLVWQEAGEIEEISVEYWNLRKIEKEYRDLQEKVAKAEEILNKSHAERSELLNEVSENQQQLDQKRLDLTKELESFANRRDQIVAEAREVRRHYDGMKIKLAVLASEGSDDLAVQAEKTRVRMSSLRGSFQALRDKRIAIGREIEEGDRKLHAIEEQLAAHHQQRRQDASETFHVIGKANRDISNHRAQLGLIETRRQQLFAEIGRYVSRHALSNPALAKIYPNHTSMIDLMVALRRSIILNRKLGGRLE